MELIPDLPETMARECLLRTSYKQFPLISSVCKLWKQEISLPDFLRHRKASIHSQELVVFSQARVDPVSKLGSGKTIPTPVYRISVLEPESGLWSELPLVPGKSNGLPLFCRLASVGSDLVVIGGLDPVTWRTSDSVFIFSFLTSTWRNGTAMPGGPRSFFACASDSDQRNVFVAGGHDEDKNALTSALVYDVAEDIWASLPDMGRGRDECTATFHAGKFHVIGGYATEEQGQFSKTAESFDVATWLWGQETSDFLSQGMTTWPPVCVAGENGGLYACCRRDLMVKSGNTWQKVWDLPDDVCNVSYMAVRRSGKVVVIGSPRYGEPSIGYSWDMSNSRWVKLEIHEKYEGHVQAGCFLEI